MGVHITLSSAFASISTASQSSIGCQWRKKVLTIRKVQIDPRCVPWGCSHLGCLVVRARGFRRSRFPRRPLHKLHCPHTSGHGLFDELFDVCVCVEGRRGSTSGSTFSISMDGPRVDFESVESHCDAFHRGFTPRRAGEKSGERALCHSGW